MEPDYTPSPEAFGRMRRKLQRTTSEVFRLSRAVERLTEQVRTLEELANERAKVWADLWREFEEKS